MGTAPNARGCRHTAFCHCHLVRTVSLVTMQPLFLSSSSSPSANEPLRLLFKSDYKTWSTCKSYSGYLLETLNNKRKSPYSAVFEVKAAIAKHVLFASRKSCLWSQEFCKNRMKKTKALKPSTNRYLHQVKKLLKVFNKAITVMMPQSIWALILCLRSVIFSTKS